MWAVLQAAIFISISHHCYVSAAEQIKPAPAFSANELRALPRDNWDTNGGNLYNQRYSPLNAINRDNVSQVKAEWRTHLNGSGMKPQTSGQGQILFHDGTLYQVTGEDDVFALDVESGRILWTYTANLNPANVIACCGWVSRGLGMGDGRIYVGRLDGKLVALNQRTGKVTWSIQAEDPHKGFSITAAPLYYNGMVIIGFAGGEMGIRGRLKAYDAKTGKLVWTFYTIPGPGQFGHDTWPADNDAWKYGGAPIWQTPAIDPELGMIYFSTGNANPDFNGATRAGDNLFTASIIALDVATGKYRWHFQQVHHDIWDYDAPSPVVLFDAKYNGKMRKAIAEIPKTGWVYILDRVTGRPILPIEERPVPQEPRQHTSATQPYVIGDSIVPQSIDIPLEGIDLINGGRIFTPFWGKKMVIYKPQMAVNWPPTSYDPQTNTLFICAIDNVGNSTSDAKQDFEVPGFKGMRIGSVGTARTGAARLGVFGAMDLTSNRLVWRQQMSDACLSGSIATAGGLVLTGRSDGRLLALDSRNGRILWSFHTDAGVNAPVSTFEYKGVQYIAAFSAGTLFSTAVKGDSVWLFSLNGKMDEVATPAAAPQERPRLEQVAPQAAASKPPAPARPPAKTQLVEKPEAAVTATVAAGTTAPAMPGMSAAQQKGHDIYVQVCQPCHGSDGQGGPGGGAPLTDSLTIDAIQTILYNGRNSMPEFGSVYSDEQIDDIANFVLNQLINSGND